MKAYLVTTGTVFGLITIAHVLRMMVEGLHLAREPLYIFLTLAAAGLSIWAWRLLWRSTRM